MNHSNYLEGGAAPLGASRHPRYLAHRRNILKLAALVGARFTAGCIGQPSDPNDDDGAIEEGGSGGNGSEGGGPTHPMGGNGQGGEGGGPVNPGAPIRAGVASFDTPGNRRAAVQRAVELAGGMPWIKPGDRVCLKVAHNGFNAYPTTVSPESVGELAKLCLAAGAGQVIVADVMGIENTLVPGGWAMEDMYGLWPFNYDNDATIRAFRHSGLYGGVEAAVGANNVGPDKQVYITSFREHGWRRFESASAMPASAGAARMHSPWVRSQLEVGVNKNGVHEPRIYTPRTFDVEGEVPGMYMPRLFDEVDHIINVSRVATHVMSHFTCALKNWVGTMRPDDRIWMHQLSAMLNTRGSGFEPIRTEPPYNEILAELHLSTKDKERLVFADASQIIVSGGPDESPDPYYPAQLMLAAKDVITADVITLSILRIGILAAMVQGGLGGVCEEQPGTLVDTTFDYLAWRLSLSDQGLMRGTDVKLCDPNFSNWDWVVIQRARELGLGPAHPSDVGIAFDDTGSFAVPEETRTWIELDALRPPTT